MFLQNFGNRSRTIVGGRLWRSGTSGVVWCKGNIYSSKIIHNFFGACVVHHSECGEQKQSFVVLEDMILHAMRRGGQTVIVLAQLC